MHIQILQTEFINGQIYRKVILLLSPNHANWNTLWGVILYMYTESHGHQLLSHQQ